MDKEHVLTTLLRQFESKPASTFFINGAPGAGKMHLLNELASNVPAHLFNTQVLGPYHTANENVLSRINEDLFDLRFVESAAPENRNVDWFSNWVWLRDNLKTSSRQNFLVLIRLDDNYYDQYDELKVWFSSIRYMEHYWTNSRIRVLAVIAGFWDHTGLEDYYHEIRTSFPYTISNNYQVWNTISFDETLNLVSAKIHSNLLQPLGNLIYEITGGFAGGIVDLLKFLPPNNPSVADIFHAAHQATQEGENGNLLVNGWCKLPPNVIQTAKKLLLFKTLNDEDKKAMDLLAIAGIVAYQTSFIRSFAKIKSWYIELLLRKHAAHLGIEDAEWSKFQFSEFASPIAALNVDGYKIINYMENMIRNFALTRLFEQYDGEDHVLQYKAIRRKSYQSNEEDDILERADDWRQRSRRNGLDINLNPLISYTSTNDLVQLIKEIAISGDPLWNDISEAMEKITPIRDAVMHNQLIDERSLESLYQLQAKVLMALNR